MNDTEKDKKYRQMRKLSPYGPTCEWLGLSGINYNNIELK